MLGENWVAYNPAADPHFPLWNGHLAVYFIFWANPHQRLFIAVLCGCYALNTDIMNIYELWKSAHSSPSLWGSSPRHSSISSVADTYNLKVHVSRSTGQLCEFLLDPFLPHFERPLLSSDLEVHQFWILWAVEEMAWVFFRNSSATTRGINHLWDQNLQPPTIPNHVQPLQILCFQGIQIQLTMGKHGNILGITQS